jgi:hypothetical protein
MYYQTICIIIIVKRRCTNTIIDNRRLAEDSLPFSDLKMYTEKLILHQIEEIDNHGVLLTVKYTCGQPDCTTWWLNKAGNSTTSNFQCHYRRHHPGTSIEDSNALEPVSELVCRPQTTLADFWSSSGSSSTSIVLYKQGNGVVFDPIVFIKLLINFIISNLFALYIVESILLQQLLEYCLSDIELFLCRSMM